MDGLRDDQDVIFVLTTNRPDILEPALAARPGRIDLAIELPLPDAEGRRHLLELYSRGLDLAGVDLDGLVDRIEGATPAYVKELLRKATLRALEAGAGETLRQEDIDGALDELAQGGRLAERMLGFRPEQSGPAGPQGGPPPGMVTGSQSVATGFPASVMFRRKQ
jgi:ATP-dependent 26S proteasome regulatory subunit